VQLSLGCEKTETELRGL